MATRITVVEDFVAGEQLCPVPHALVGGDHDGAPAISVRHQPKEDKLASWRLIGSKPSSSISSSAVDMNLRRFNRIVGKAASAFSAVIDGAGRRR